MSVFGPSGVLKGNSTSTDTTRGYVHTVRFVLPKHDKPGLYQPTVINAYGCDSPPPANGIAVWPVFGYFPSFILK